MAHMLYSVLLHIKPVLLTFSVVITKLNQWSAFSADSEQRVRERDFRTTPANKDAGGATGGPWPEARPQSRSKVAQGDSNRTKAKKAAPKPAKQPEKQPEKQPGSHMPVEAPAAHRNEAACLPQSTAQVELPPQTNAEQSKVQAPGVKDQSSPLQQGGPIDVQAPQQTAQAKKQKAARRKAAKNKGAKLQTKPSASSSDLSASSPIADRCSQEEPAAMASVQVAGEASAKPVTQPHKDEQTLHKLSSPKPSPSEPARELPQALRQSTSEIVQSTGRSGSSAGPDSAPCGPCLPVAPTGQPTIARAAPVKLSRATLQQSQSSPANFRPPPLHALLPTSAPQLHHMQVRNSSEAASVCP